MRIALLIIGLLALAIGLLWIGQGTGVVAWQKTSFMFDQIQWAGYSTPGKAARDAGARLSPTDPKLSVEPDPVGPKPVQPADHPAPG
jgi:hypothetical protein